MHWFHRALLTLALVAAATVAAVFAEWLPLLGHHERAALRFMQQAGSTPAGENGFAVLWTARHEVPVDQIDQVVQTDLRTVNANGWRDFRSAAEAYPTRPHPDYIEEGLCTDDWAKSCLESVRQRPAAALEALTRFSEWIALSDSLRDFGHVRSTLPLALDAPIPPLTGLASVAVTRAALAFVDGRTAAGLDDACGTALTWRRLRSGTDMYIVGMVGSEYSTMAVRLANEMLAELPQNIDMPVSCRDAMAPLSEHEQDPCEMYRGEFRQIATTLSQERLVRETQRGVDGPGWGRRLVSMAYNEHHTTGLAAARMIGACGVSSASSAKCSTFAAVLNPLGCEIVAKIDWTSYVDSTNRNVDFDRRLALARAALWWRAQPGADAGDAPVWPDAFMSIRGEITLDATTRSLSLPMRDRSRPANATFRLRY